MDEKKTTSQKKDRTVLYISAGIALLFVLLSVLFTDGTNAVFNQLFALITTNFGWLYLIAVGLLWLPPRS